MRHKLLFLPFLIAIVGLWMLGNRPVSSSQAASPMVETPGLRVVELFTSQSCSSCPPADDLLVELSKNDNVLAFSCHVTYWDHLNWRDTLSRKFCTERQRAYARSQGKRQVYTPQMVIDGAHEFVGSNRREALNILSQSPQQVQPIALIRKDLATLSATLPQLTDDAPLQTLWLLSYIPTHTQAIPSGENRGRTITYANSVATLDQIGTWDGRAQTLTVPLPDHPKEAMGFAIIAQPQGFGHISAAGKI